MRRAVCGSFARNAERPAPSQPSGLQLAQNADVEVYFDGNGNRVTVDAYTGEVLSVERPVRRLSREAPAVCSVSASSAACNLAISTSSRIRRLSHAVVSMIPASTESWTRRWQ